MIVLDSLQYPTPNARHSERKCREYYYTTIEDITVSHPKHVNARKVASLKQGIKSL
jgi:hypothetical protein